MLRLLERQIFRNINNKRKLNTWSLLATAFNSTVNEENHLVNVSKKEAVSLYIYMRLSLLIYYEK